MERINPYTILVSRVPTIPPPLGDLTMPEECREIIRVYRRRFDLECREQIREYQEHVRDLEGKLNKTNVELALAKDWKNLLTVHIQLLKTYTHKETYLLYNVVVCLVEQSGVTLETLKEHELAKKLEEWANDLEKVEDTLEESGDFEEKEIPLIKQVLTIFQAAGLERKHQCAWWVLHRYDLLESLGEV
jgi:hypothetical protein